MSILTSTAPVPATHLKAEEIIRQLKRFQALEIQSTRLLGGWMPGVLRWEIKHEIGLHLWQDAQHSKELRTRLWELRVSHPDRTPDPDIAPLIKGLASSETDYEFLAGCYFVFKTELVSAYRAIVATTHGVHDAPTVAILKRILPEKEAQLAWAAQEINQLLATDDRRHRAERWMDYARQLLVAAGGIAGNQPRANGEPVLPPPGSFCQLPFAGAKRDERFTMAFGGLPMPDENDHDAKVLFQFYNYTQEMQAAETLGSTLWETEGMEWEFYYDIARHCYDEERHSALGEARLAQLGRHVTEFPNTVTNYAWRQLYDPLRRYAVLTYVIEADSFKYKHQTYQDHLKNSDTESAEAVLYDIIDETIHVRFGQKWVPKLMERYGYIGSIDQLVAECREILLAHSVNPLQRAAAKQNQKT